jgi:hypothetical protein
MLPLYFLPHVPSTRKREEPIMVIKPFMIKAGETKGVPVEIDENVVLAVSEDGTSKVTSAEVRSSPGAIIAIESLPPETGKCLISIDCVYIDFQGSKKSTEIRSYMEKDKIAIVIGEWFLYNEQKIGDEKRIVAVKVKK